jgi:hypothetical protein
MKKEFENNQSLANPRMMIHEYMRDKNEQKNEEQNNNKIRTKRNEQNRTNQ